MFPGNMDGQLHTCSSCSSAGRVVRIALLLFGLSLPPPALPAQPTPYGETFVQRGAFWPEGGELPRVASAPDPAVAGAYRARLETLEQSVGPYADALAEPLASLAGQLQQQGDFGSAQRLYQRALHVVRINDGLYSERQLPILKSLLEIQRSTGDLEGLDQRYDYYFRLFGGGRAPYSDTSLRTALEYLRWQREALRQDLDGEEAARRRMLRLYNLNGELLETAGADPALDPRWYRALVQSQLRNLYLIRERVEPRLETIGTLEQRPLFIGEVRQEDVDTVRLQGIEKSSLSRGRELLEGLLGRIPQAEPAERAGASLELGDWYQWNGRGGEAQRYYLDAQALLRQAGQQAESGRLFSQPVELPDNGVFWQPPTAGADDGRVINATFDVTAQGRAGNIEASAADPDDEGSVGRLRRELAATRFRPRYEDGEPVATEGVARQYQLLE